VNRSHRYFGRGDLAPGRSVVLFPNEGITVRSITSYVEGKFRMGRVSVMFITELSDSSVGVPVLEAGKNSGPPSTPDSTTGMDASRDFGVCRAGSNSG